MKSDGKVVICEADMVRDSSQLSVRELESATALATKRVLSGQILRAMKQKNISQAELARRMRTSRAVIHRLLDENDSSVTLSTISKAAAALGRGVRLKLSA